MTNLKIVRSKDRSRLKAILITLPIVFYGFVGLPIGFVMTTVGMFQFGGIEETGAAGFVQLTVLGAICFFLMIIVLRFLSFVEVRLRSPVVRMLWLRKFDADRGRFFKITHVMDRLFRYHISPVFLSDRTLEVSDTSRGYKVASAIVPLSLITQIGVLGYLLYFFYYDLWYMVPLEYLMLVVLALLAAFPIMLLLVAVTWVIVSVTHRANAPVRTAQQIKSKLSPESYQRRAQMFRSTDEDWQQSVEFLLEVSDVVVFDVTHLNPNLFWELETTIASKPAERIIFIYEKGERLSADKATSQIESFKSRTGLEKANFLVHRGGQILGEKQLGAFEEHLAYQIHRCANGEYTPSLVEDIIVASSIDEKSSSGGRSNARRRRR